MSPARPVADVLDAWLRPLREAAPLLVCALSPLAVVAFFLGLAWLLGGCAAPEPQIRVVREPVEVRVPVPVPCIEPERVPRLPVLAGDAALAGLADYDLVLTIEAQRRLLRAHQQQTDALLAACARAPSVPPTKESPQ